MFFTEATTLLLLSAMTACDDECGFGPHQNLVEILGINVNPMKIQANG